MGTQQQEEALTNLHIEVELEEQKRKAERAKAYKKGLRFAVIAWIHAGGDDYEMEWKSNQPFTTKWIVSQIKKLHSHVTDDYTRFEILENGELKQIQ